MLELRPDSDERLTRVERLADDLEQSRPFLQDLEQALIGVELLAAQVLEQTGRAADVEPLPLGRHRLLEQRGDRSEEGTLAWPEPGIVEPAPQDAAAQLESADLVVQIRGRPIGEHRVDGVG